MHARTTLGALVYEVSTVGVRAAPETIVYAASKAAQIRMAQGLTVELAGDDVRVNAVAPGVVDTNMIADRSPDVLRALGEAHPPGASERWTRWPAPWCIFSTRSG